MNNFFDLETVMIIHDAENHFCKPAVGRLAEQLRKNYRGFLEDLQESKDNETIIKAGFSYQKNCMDLADSLLKISSFPLTESEMKSITEQLFINQELNSGFDFLNAKLKDNNPETRRYMIKVLQNEAVLDALLFSGILTGSLRMRTCEEMALSVTVTPYQSTVKQGEEFVACISLSQRPLFKYDKNEIIFTVNGKTYKSENGFIIWSEQTTEIGLHHCEVKTSLKKLSGEECTATNIFDYNVVP